MKILVATHNKGKLRELADLLADLPIQWVTLSDLGIEVEVEETGATFEENARLKAAAYAEISRLITLADDSGLEVDALQGAPGVYSARYGSPQAANDTDRYQLVLDRLSGVSDEQRGARFRCVIALAVPDGDIRVAGGVCEGRIGYEPRGSHGFGYDPIFQMPEHGATLAELGPSIKNRISHRARAIAAIRPEIEALLRSSDS